MKVFKPIGESCNSASQLDWYGDRFWTVKFDSKIKEFVRDDICQASELLVKCIRADDDRMVVGNYYQMKYSTLSTITCASEKSYNLKFSGANLLWPNSRECSFSTEIVYPTKEETAILILQGKLKKLTGVS